MCKSFPWIMSTSNSFLSRTTDDLVPLFGFIILQVSELHKHLGSYVKIMDEFISPQVAAREEGYALAVLHTALKHIRSIDLQH